MHHLKFGLRIDCNTTTAGRKRSYARPVKIEASLRALPPFAAAFLLRPELPRKMAAQEDWLKIRLPADPRLSRERGLSQRERLAPAPLTYCDQECFWCCRGGLNSPPLPYQGSGLN